MCQLHLFHYIRTQALAQGKQLADNSVCLCAKGPDLDRSSRLDHHCRAGFGIAIAMHTQYGTESAVLEPAHSAFTQCRGCDTCTAETAGIDGPPRNTTT